MKKSMLTLAGLLLVSALAVNAQSTDTIPGRKKDTLKQQGSNYKRSQESYSLRDLTIVPATDIPEVLRQTLSAPEYKGWDAQTSTIYKNRTGDLFIVEINDRNVNRVYHFDGEGRRIKEY